MRRRCCRGFKGTCCRTGWGDRPHFVTLTPPANAVPHSSLVHMFAVVHREFGAADSDFFGDLSADGSWLLDLVENARGLA